MDPRLLDAARSGDVDLLKKMAEEDADLLRGVTPFRNTALHIAVTFKQQEFVEEICARKPALLGERNRNCETPLHAAAILGSHRAVVFFLGLDVGWIDMKGLLRAVDRYGNTALHAALLNGHAEVAQELVSADPRLASYINEQGESPLYLAAMRGFLAIVQRLLQCDPCDHRGHRRRTALHAAVIGGHRGIARALLESKTEISKEKDSWGKTPLHHAVTWGDLEMVRLLLKHDSSAAYVADGSGHSPVHLCAREDRVDVFFELFRRCPDALDAVDGEGRNALHIAIECQNKLVARLLMTPGLDRLLNQRDQQGNTPLHIAVEKHNPVILQQLLRIKRVDTCVTDTCGLTAPQSFYMDQRQRPGLDSAWYESHSIVSDAWAEDDACKQNFVKKNVWRMEIELLKRSLGIYSHVNLLNVATLMAVVTFLAAFMIPGWYLNEDGPEQGFAVFSRKAAVKMFLISDTISTCCSLLATYIYLTSTIKKEIDQSLYIIFGEILVLLAFLGMIIAFATGIYAVAAQTCLWLGILICILCCSLPFLAFAINRFDIRLIKMIVIIVRIVNKLMPTITEEID